MSEICLSKSQRQAVLEHFRTNLTQVSRAMHFERGSYGQRLMRSYAVNIVGGTPILT